MSSESANLHSEDVGYLPSARSSSPFAVSDVVRAVPDGSTLLAPTAAGPDARADGNDYMAVSATAPPEPVSLADTPSPVAMPVENTSVIAGGNVVPSTASDPDPAVDATLAVSSLPAEGVPSPQSHAEAPASPSVDADSDAVACSAESADSSLQAAEPRSGHRLGASRVSSIGVQAHVVILKRGASLVVLPSLVYSPQPLSL